MTDLVRGSTVHLNRLLFTRPALLSALMLVASCSLLQQHTEPSARAPAMAVKTAAAATAAVQAVPPAPTGNERSDNGISHDKGRVPQLGHFVETAPKGQPPQNNVVALNYEQEDLRSVIEQLGDTLGLNMVIDPTIDYKVSLRTSANNPLRYQDIWPLLRMLARNAGVTVEQAGNVWKFSRNASNIPVEIVQPGSLKQATSSEVLQVTPLTYISVPTLEPILAPLLQPAGSLIHMGSPSLLGIMGTPEQLARINALLSVIDDDPFQNQGIRLYQLQNSPASKVAEELTSVLKLVEGPQSSYQVLGLERINSVLVIAPANRGFDEVNRWINILDAKSQEQVEQLFVYKVKNLEAKKVAETLNTVFGEKKDDKATTTTDRRSLTRELGQPLLNNQPQQLQAPGTAQQQNATRAETALLENVAAGVAGTSANLNVNMVADEKSNSLLIRTTPREYRQLLTTINAIDSVPLQVLINAVIGQVTLNDSSKFGIDWSRVSANIGSGPATLSNQVLPGGILNTTTTNPATGVVTTTPGITNLAGTAALGSGLVLTRTFMDGAAIINATLNAIADNNEVRLLARPTLLAANNEQGDIKVGENVPVQTSTTASVAGVPPTTSYSYRDVGIVLQITPQINEEGYINLKIEQTLSSVAPNVGVGNNPVFINQEIKTVVVVADQATIILGGLIQEDQSDQKTGVPLLQNIPIIGRAFAYNQLAKSRKELFVILRPQIVYGDQRDAEAMNAMREKFTEVSKMLKAAGL